MIPKPPIHLLKRFSLARLNAIETIAEHNTVVQQPDAVWFGKMGSPVSQAYIDLLTSQLKCEIPTFDYLVKGDHRTTGWISGYISSRKVGSNK